MDKRIRDYPGPGQGPIKTGLNFYTGPSIFDAKFDLVLRPISHGSPAMPAFAELFNIMVKAPIHGEK